MIGEPIVMLDIIIKCLAWYWRDFVIEKRNSYNRAMKFFANSINLYTWVRGDCRYGSHHVLLVGRTLEFTTTKAECTLEFLMTAVTRNFGVGLWNA